MRELYPEIEPYNTGMLKVSDIHELYYEECGNPDGIPVAFLHGGPGGGSNADDRQIFNPEKYRIILFDQRGCGKSTPRGEIKENTSQHLVQDIEKIREHLGIDTWMVFGRSWGSTLALMYAIKHADKISTLFIGAVFTFTTEELEWVTGGAQDFFPDYYKKYFGHLSDEQRKDLHSYYHDCIVSGDKEKVHDVVHNFGSWHYRILTLEERKLVITGDSYDYLVDMYTVFLHYDKNTAFIEDGYIMRNLDKLGDLHTVILQGRYDMATPPEVAWQIHKTLPNSEFEMVDLAGHSTSEPANLDAILRWSDKLADK